jgi:PIN domain nuclease of toxin-antitoxin system
MSDVVIDASAVLAAINNEPGGDRGAQEARGARISALNYCEIIGWLAERGATEEDAHKVVMPFELLVEDFNRSRAMSAGLLAAKTKRRNISLGDRACLALAIELGLPALTGDRAWRDLDIGVDVRLIR